MKARMKSFFNNYLLTIYMIINILFIFVCNIIGHYVKGFYKIYSYLLIGLLVINIGIAIFIIIKNFIKNKKYKFRIYDLLLLIMVILLCISTIFSIKPMVSLFGSRNRYEGLFSIIYYYSLTYLASFVKKEHKRQIIVTIIATGVIQAMYAFLQVTGSSLPFVKSIVNNENGRLWATGFARNPNFFSTYTLICISYAIGLLLDSEDKMTKIVYIHVILILLIGQIISNTSSCAVGLICVIIYTFIYALRNKKTKYILAIILVGFLGLVYFQKAGLTTLYRDLDDARIVAGRMSNGQFDNHYGTSRFLVWRLTYKIVPKYLLHGSGPDTFMYAFGPVPIIIGGKIYDKPHNNYLNILVTQGMFCLTVYLLLIGFIGLRGTVNSYKNKEIYLVLPIIGYVVQDFFNISVIHVAPIYFISLGLLIDRNDNLNSKFYRDYLKPVVDTVLAIIIFILLLPIFILISLLIIIFDHTNPLYFQKRTGKDGVEFTMIKFKTMKGKKVTKLGKLLRMVSVDELPQLINIIMGDMSLIGPRAWIVDYYERFNDKQKRRVEVKPGIIGLAQVNGRNNISILQKIDYDTQYVDNISLLLDLKILFKSLGVIIIKEDSEKIEEHIESELKELEISNSKKKKRRVKKSKK